MTAGTPRISKQSARQLRELLVDVSTLGRIRDLFDPAGFVPDEEFVPSVSGERRWLIECYYHAIDWVSADHTRRMLQVIEQVLWQTANIESNLREGLLRCLARDGFMYADGRLVPAGGSLGDAALSELRDDSAILMHLQRLDGTDVEARPEEAIGASKDLIESALKTVLDRMSEPYAADEKIPGLVRKAQTALHLHKSVIAPTAPGADIIMKILGNLSQLAVGIAELRNEPGYGVGHGHAKRIGVRGRHARLVVRSALAYVGFLFETLNDPGAPWQKPGGTLVSHQSAANLSTSGASSA
jgi:hypothetical protein